VGELGAKTKTMAAIAATWTTVLITGCAIDGTLVEITREEATAFRSRVGPGNPFVGKTDDITENALWLHAQLVAGILVNDKSVEKFEEGGIKVKLASGEAIEGNFLGYRPQRREHCTRSWISNLYYFDSRGGYLASAGGVAVLKGDQGTLLLCGYDWLGPDCQREGICRAKESKYYKLTF
jgi:hypothetical protein